MLEKKTYSVIVNQKIISFISLTLTQIVTLKKNLNIDLIIKKKNIENKFTFKCL